MQLPETRGGPTPDTAFDMFELDYGFGFQKESVRFGGKGTLYRQIILYVR